MKEIKAYVREVMLEQVMSALADIDGIPGIAVVHLREYGHVQDEKIWICKPSPTCTGRKLFRQKFSTVHVVNIFPK